MLKILIPRVFKNSKLFNENPKLLYLYALIKYRDFYKLTNEQVYKYYTEDWETYVKDINRLEWICKRKYHTTKEEIYYRYYAVWETLVKEGEPEEAGSAILVRLYAKNGVIATPISSKSKYYDGLTFNRYYIPIHITDKFKYEREQN